MRVVCICGELETPPPSPPLDGRGDYAASQNISSLCLCVKKHLNVSLSKNISMSKLSIVNYQLSIIHLLHGVLKGGVGEAFEHLHVVFAALFAAVLHLAVAVEVQSEDGSYVVHEILLLVSDVSVGL